MRGLALYAFATLALGGCAVSHSLPSPVASSPGAATPPQPSLYATAPRGSVHSELLACNGGSGANVGELGPRGETVAYTPYL
ncbi:MAG: hypothetical protein ACREH4_15045, partial [Vitreimonas sp.]